MKFGFAARFAWDGFSRPESGFLPDLRAPSLSNYGKASAMAFTLRCARGRDLSTWGMLGNDTIGAVRHR